jgi:uncharacterized repeat protein (TIGR04076 family)
MTARIRCTVESMAYSACGMVPGDAFEVDELGTLTIPNGRPFCYFAIAQVVPHLVGRLDGLPEDEWLNGSPLVACPDPPEALWMRLERLQPDVDTAITNGGTHADAHFEEQS